MSDLTSDQLAELSKIGLIQIKGIAFTACFGKKNHECSGCGELVERGFKIFRPLSEGNGVRRCDRFCFECAEKKRAK